MKRWVLTSVCVFLFASAAHGQQAIRLANNPALSPDGQQLAFDWNGDVWIVRAGGGEARQLTTHPGRDSQPKFAPDGQKIAFISDREGSPQVFTVSVDGEVLL